MENIYERECIFYDGPSYDFGASKNPRLRNLLYGPDNYIRLPKEEVSKKSPRVKDSDLEKKNKK